MKPAAARQTQLKHIQRTNTVVAQLVGRVDVNGRLGSRDEMDFDFLLVDGVAGTESRGATKAANCRGERDEEGRQTADVCGALHSVSIVDGKCVETEVTTEP